MLNGGVGKGFFFGRVLGGQEGKVKREEARMWAFSHSPSPKMTKAIRPRSFPTDTFSISRSASACSGPYRMTQKTGDICISTTRDSHKGLPKGFFFLLENSKPMLARALWKRGGGEACPLPAPSPRDLLPSGSDTRSSCKRRGRGRRFKTERADSLGWVEGNRSGRG